MKIFLIQTINKEIVHDFSFYLIEAIKYNNWYYNKNSIYYDRNSMNNLNNKTYDYILSDEVILPKFNDIQYYPLNDIIPIGTVEFVLEFINVYYKNNVDTSKIRPMNIPNPLMNHKFLKRNVKIIKTETNTINAGDTKIFVKDNLKIKGFCDIISKNYGYPAGEWLVSNLIDIESEWRSFIYKNELIGLINYSGNFTMFPDVNLIKDMIKVLDKKEPYSLDVGINSKDGTFLIETHKFVSLGLYGDCIPYSILPTMFIQGFKDFVNC